ncbi:FkbM family methyltransferase [Salipiger mucosus]|uniref:Methyltransferase FkbM n=1 Tax=Salipiger mucosus DSM 16094 TaxID=1123237 RepID=S9QFI5_9RHOB|nr:FkbM family methyltransferase [Salipiger mucosus]EPX78627.1 Methyltransferase FkbM [Salipiger mucosus DSM 16094]
MARRDTPLRRLKYRLLSRLPGQAGLNYARKLRKLDAPRAEAQMRAALEASAGGICIDLGANMGVHSRTMAARAGKVYAFEPDPWTAARLRENLSDLPNVEVIEAAAGPEAGTVHLYRTPDFDSDRETQSQSSSLLAEKRNIDREHAIDVEMVDFPAFLEGLEGEISVIKMDIEGAEVALMEALLDHPVLERIGHIFVETHESRIPELAPRTEALRARARGLSRPVINLDWK